MSSRPDAYLLLIIHLGPPLKIRWFARAQSNKEFLYGSVYPGTGEAPGKVEQKV